MKTFLLIALLCIVAVLVVAAALWHSRRSSPMYRRRFVNGAPMKERLAPSARALRPPRRSPPMYRRRFVNGAPMKERLADSRGDDANAAVWYPVVLMSNSS